MDSSLGGMMWVMAVNLVIWTGLFLYLLHLNRKIRELEREARADGSLERPASLEGDDSQ